MVLVNKRFSRFIRKIKINYEHIAVIQISSLLFGTNTKVYLTCKFLPSVGSPFYEVSDFNNGMSTLEHRLLEVLEKLGKVAIILCGDLNSKCEIQRNLGTY